MMSPHDCAQIRERFSEILDGSLDPEEAARLRTAIESCADCRVEFSTLRRTVGQIGHLRRPAPPAFVESVKSRIRERSRGRFFGRRHLLFGRIPFEWLSFIMIVAMLVYYVVLLRSTPTEVTPAP